jgi:uncharacterized protein (DUF302 family)
MSSHTVSVMHHTFKTPRPFDEVVDKIKSQLGRYDSAALADKAHPNLRQRFLDMEGSSGFMLFDTIDHGALLVLAGQSGKALQIVLGNPLFALEMTRIDIAAALYAPLRMLVYASQGETVIEYDQPSTLFGGGGNEAVRQASLPLDEKMQALVHSVL